MEYDVQVLIDGHMVGFKPVTDAGRYWFDENVAYDDESLFGGFVWAEGRFGGDIIKGGTESGLKFGLGA